MCMQRNEDHFKNHFRHLCAKTQTKYTTYTADMIFFTDQSVEVTYIVKTVNLCIGANLVNKFCLYAICLLTRMFFFIALP